MAEAIPVADQICKCGHWYDEHVATDSKGKAYCEGCYQSIEPQGSFGTDADLEASLGFTHEHEFKFDQEASTPEAIADRGGDPESWPQHVKEHFNINTHPED